MKIDVPVPVDRLVADPLKGRVALPEQAQAENRGAIMALEAAMFAARDDGAFKEGDFPLTHTFTEGAYARQMLIPKGHAIVGKIHRHAHLNFVLSGHASVMTENGLMEVRGPMMFVSTPGVKRAVYAHEDTTWVTVHVTNKTDLAEIEDEIIAKSFDDLALPVIAKPAQGVELLGVST